MSRTQILTAAIAAAVLSGGVAVAASAQGHGGGNASGSSRKLMRADQNGDGVVTRQEAMAAAGRQFDKRDRNHDGKLDATEMTKRGKGAARRQASTGE